MRKSTQIILLLTCFVLGIVISIRYQNSNNTTSTDTLVFEAPKSLPAFSVLDQNGQEVNNQVLQGHWSFVFFGFTNCPDVCPNTLSILAEVQNRKSVKSDQPQIVLVSVDPMRDTPELLKTYVSSFSSNILGFTGELHQIQVLTDALGVAYAYNAMPDGSYTVDHTAAIFIINPDGEYQGIYTGSLAAQHAIETLSRDFAIISRQYVKN